MSALLTGEDLVTFSDCNVWHVWMDGVAMYFSPNANIVLQIDKACRTFTLRKRDSSARWWLMGCQLIGEAIYNHQQRDTLHYYTNVQRWKTRRMSSPIVKMIRAYEACTMIQRRQCTNANNVFTEVIPYYIPCVASP